MSGRWRTDDNGEIYWEANEDYADDSHDREAECLDT